jgi:hypothetical protein
MFFSFFSSANQKLVKKWKQEHEQIVVLAHKVIAEYSTNNFDATKKALVELNKITVNHLMVEDIELHKLSKDLKRIDSETEIAVNEFKESFRGTKTALMSFLTKYTRQDVPLDDEFFTTFNGLVEVLAERIAFEEKNLYSKMDVK